MNGVAIAASRFANICRFDRISRKNWLVSSEKTMAIVALVAFGISLALISYRDINLDGVALSIEIAIMVGILAIGFFYRQSGRSERIGATIICMILFIFFSTCMSMFNYQMLPLWREPIDLSLNAVDQMFGYHWPAVIEWAGQHPTFNKVVRFAYGWTILQFVAIVGILGISGQGKELHVMIASITLTATFTICFWGFFPSLGAYTLYDLPQAMESLASPNLGTAYGDYLLILAQQGPNVESIMATNGLITFPSYHIVLSCIALYSMRSIKWAFPVFLVPNILVVPGIFMHGGHHLVDLPAGVIVAIGGIYFARKMVSSQYGKDSLPEFMEK